MFISNKAPFLSEWPLLNIEVEPAITEQKKADKETDIKQTWPLLAAFKTLRLRLKKIKRSL